MFVCTRCNKRCKNAGGLATHVKTHAKEVESPSLLRFLKRAPAKKAAIELKPISRRPQQLKFSAKKNAPLTITKPDPPVSAQPKPQVPAPPPPRCPRNYRKTFQDLSPFIAPPDLTASDLKKRSAWFDDYNNDVKTIKDEILYKSGHFLIHLALHLDLPQSV